MPPPTKPPNGRPPPTDDTDPGAPVDMLKTGQMRTVPRKPDVKKLAPRAPEPDEEESTDVAPAAPGDATLIYDQNKGRAAAPGAAPRLIITAGPKAGSEVQLTSIETSLGRGGDNTIVIPDISVSRRHVVIRKEGRHFVVLDQGSGNGTRVNGVVVGRHELQTGDVIDLGDTSMQFVEAGGVLVKGGKRTSGAHGQAAQVAPRVRAAKPAAPERPELTNPRATGLQKRTPLYLGLAVLLLAILAFGAWRRGRHERSEGERTEQPGGPKAVAQQRFAEAQELVRQGKWLDARDKLTIAASLDEGNEPIKRYLERARAEAPRAQAVAAAQAALDRRNFKAAREHLAGVPDDSALAEKAAELTTTVRTQIDAAVRDAKAKADSGDHATAEALVAPVLEAEPTRRDALAVREQLDARRRPARRASAESDEPGEAGEPPPERTARPARTTRPVERDDAPPPDAVGVGHIVDAYLAGDVRTALTRAESAGVTDSSAARLARQLRELDAAYREGLARLDARKPGEAIRAFETAARVDQAIAKGRDSRLGTEIKRGLAKVHQSLGAASLSTDAGLPRAAQHLRAAVAADPANDVARQQLDQVVSRAKEIYLRGYVAKDNDAEAAKTAFRLVVDTLPKGDATADKAQRWLEKLEGKAKNDDG